MSDDQTDDLEGDAYTNGGPLILGQVVWLLMRSSLHQRYRLAAIERYTFPPILFGQFRLYRDGQKPIAYTSWALMSPQAEERFLTSHGRIETEDWQSGNRLWIMDLVAPFGHARRVVDDLRSNVFPGRQAKAIRAARKKGEEPKIIRLRGKRTQEDSNE